MCSTVICTTEHTAALPWWRAHWHGGGGRWPATNCCHHKVFHYVAYNNPIIALISPARTETNQIIGLTFDLFIVYRWRLLPLAATASKCCTQTHASAHARALRREILLACDHVDRWLQFFVTNKIGSQVQSLAFERVYRKRVFKNYGYSATTDGFVENIRLISEFRSNFIE